MSKYFVKYFLILLELKIPVFKGNNRLSVVIMNQLTVDPFHVLARTSPEVEQGVDVLLVAVNRGEPNLQVE